MRGKGAGGRLLVWLPRGAVLVGALAAAASLIYSHRQIEALREEIRGHTRAYAELIGQVAGDTTGAAGPLDLAVSRMIAAYEFPYVVTDGQGEPLAWRGISISGVEDPEGRLGPVRRAVDRFDRSYEPIRLEVPGSVQIFHYGDPPAVRRLRVVPYVQLAVLALVVALVWWSLRAGVQRQRSLVWVGLARESAHQLGTPLSSLQGWMRLLRERLETGPPPAAAAPGTGEPEPEELLDAMEEDVGRLARLTGRFARMGGDGTPEPVDMVALMQQGVAYMRRRAPQLGAAVTLHENYEQVPPVAGRADLLEWIIENLLRNAIDAVGSGGGLIEVAIAALPGGGEVRATVSDSGVGIPPSDHKRIFEAGFSTRRRGWGLGLPLARRLAEMHGGRLQLRQSRPGEGSVFELRLPAWSADVSSSGNEETEP